MCWEKIAKACTLYLMDKRIKYISFFSTVKAQFTILRNGLYWVQLYMLRIIHTEYLTLHIFPSWAFLTGLWAQDITTLNISTSIMINDHIPVEISMMQVIINKIVWALENDLLEHTCSTWRWVVCTWVWRLLAQVPQSYLQKKAVSLVLDSWIVPQTHG